MEQFQKKLNSIAIEAGARTLKYFRAKNLAVTFKTGESPLTAADLEAHEYIMHELKNLTPLIPIISEENESILDYESRKNWKQFWLVDPLDGTKEFVNGSDEFTVNIALIENGEPTRGVIYVPAKNLLYYAIKGQGSWKQNGTDVPVRVVSSSPKMTEGLRVVESRSHPSRELEDYLKSLNVKVRVSAGSSLKFCVLAEGLADIYPRMSPTMEWDVAAGDCIFRNSAAEGFRKSTLTYNKPTLKNENFVIGW